MDRRLKERLVGATILVVLLVLIVPWLLSGPQHSTPAPGGGSVRTVIVDLGTRRSIAADPPASTASNAPGDTPLVPGAAASASPGGTLSVTPLDPAPAPQAALASPVPAPTSTIGAAGRARWAVQLGSFASRANAERLVHELKREAVSAYVSTSGTGAAQRYRVRSGALPDRRAAERLRVKLAALGHPATVLAP